MIVVCSRCGKYVATRAEQKTKVCPYCGVKIVLYKCRRVASAGNASEASQILRTLKKRAAERGKS